MKEFDIEFPRPCSESWDQMTPQGRNRHCARCSSTIYDLSQHSPREVHSLLLSGAPVCGRGQFDTAGKVRLRPTLRYRVRKALNALVVSVSLLAIPGIAMAGGKQPAGQIKGMVDDAYSDRVWVVVTNEKGEQRTAKVSQMGGYKIKKLPPGNYTLSFRTIAYSNEDETTKVRSWDWGRVTVEARKTVVVNSGNPYAPEPIVGVFSRRRR